MEKKKWEDIEKFVVTFGKKKRNCIDGDFHLDIRPAHKIRA